MAKATKSAKKTGFLRGGFIAVIIGLAIAGLGVFMALSIFTGDVGIDPRESAETCWTGLLGAWMAYGAIFSLGRVPALLLALLLFCWGLHIARAMRFLTTWPQAFGGGLIVASTALGVCAFGDSYDLNSGGLLAVYVSPPAILYFGRWGMILAAVGVMILGILLAFGEAAVNSVHRGVFLLRDASLGLLGMGLRIGHLLKLLVSPRLAVAGGAVGEEQRGSVGDRAASRPKRETRAKDDASADVPNLEDTHELASGSQSAEPVRREPLKEYKPREGFQSRFLDLDLRDDAPAPISEPVQAAIAAPAKPEPVADIIMDVDAEPEESDALDDEEEALMPPPPPPAAPVKPVVEQRPRITPEPRTRPAAEPATRIGAYGAERPAAPIVGTDMTNYSLPTIEMLDPPEPPVNDAPGKHG
ncbi:MAG: hypothetical protein LUC93_10645, partial [Planctomycetaceae bacterium]|nr:hypothetical protein [Planctomycetaceae bacterium]